MQSWRHGEVLRFEGALKPFLDFPGSGAMQLFEMADAGIRAELRALVYRCRRDRTPLQGAQPGRIGGGSAGVQRGRAGAGIHLEQAPVGPAPHVPAPVLQQAQPA